MIVRPVFTNSQSSQIIESLREPDTIFTIRMSHYNTHVLMLEFLVVRTSIIYSVYIDYSEDLVSAIDREVEYRNGMIMFTEADFMPVLETDYTVPMVEDVEECPVCYESYEPMYGSLCGHHVCNDCMISMDARGLTKCPLCRSSDFKFPIALACNRSFVKV